MLLKRNFLYIFKISYNIPTLKNIELGTIFIITLPAGTLCNNNNILNTFIFVLSNKVNFPNHFCTAWKS